MSMTGVSEAVSGMGLQVWDVWSGSRAEILQHCNGDLAGSRATRGQFGQDATAICSGDGGLGTAR